MSANTPDASAHSHQDLPRGAAETLAERSGKLALNAHNRSALERGGLVELPRPLSLRQPSGGAPSPPLPSVAISRISLVPSPFSNHLAELPRPLSLWQPSVGASSSHFPSVTICRSSLVPSPSGNHLLELTRRLSLSQPSVGASSSHFPSVTICWSSLVPSPFRNHLVELPPLGPSHPLPSAAVALQEPSLNPPSPPPFRSLRLFAPSASLAGLSGGFRASRFAVGVLFPQWRMSGKRTGPPAYQTWYPHLNGVAKTGVSPSLESVRLPCQPLVYFDLHFALCVYNRISRTSLPLSLIRSHLFPSSPSCVFLIPSILPLVFFVVSTPLSLTPFLSLLFLLFVSLVSFFPLIRLPRDSHSSPFSFFFISSTPLSYVFFTSSSSSLTIAFIKHPFFFFFFYFLFLFLFFFLLLHRPLRVKSLPKTPSIECPSEFRRPPVWTSAPSGQGS
ncbi:hypothetical protein C7M84_020666 [Penaeus vannamei]|uniref:Uncharacterized protein n=1 Tax=Penaeus vannamei TaxID=6689 RepID=A0A423SBI7_PENVA|nr:hypothetical protein C7M84_020666 [Penaeus vannamei]